MLYNMSVAGVRVVEFGTNRSTASFRGNSSASTICTYMVASAPTTACIQQQDGNDRCKLTYSGSRSWARDIKQRDTQRRYGSREDHYQRHKDDHYHASSLSTYHAHTYISLCIWRPNPSPMLTRQAILNINVVHR